MSDPLVLTYAEVGFLLATRPEVTDRIRTQIHLPADADERDVRSGVASLLARGLCRVDEPGVVPGDEVAAVIAALCTCTVRMSAVGWSGPKVSMWHVFGGPNACAALVPQQYGQFAVTLLDPVAPIETIAVRMLEATVGTPESGLVVRLTRGEQTSGAAIAVDETGTWYVTDTATNPNRGVPVSRQEAVERLTIVVGPALIGAAA